MPAQSGLALQAIWEPLRQKYSIPKKPLITEKELYPRRGSEVRRNSGYGEIVRSSLSSAGSMMPTSIDPHALHRG